MKQFVSCVLGYVIIFLAISFCRSALAAEVKQIGYLPDAQFEQICDKVTHYRKVGNLKGVATLINSSEYDELIKTAQRYHDSERFNALVNYKIMNQMDLDLSL